MRQAVTRRRRGTAYLTEADPSLADVALVAVDKVDVVGLEFAATWGGSDEGKAEAERVAAYTEAHRRRLWGE